jgi:hypothetical protein
MLVPGEDADPAGQLQTRGGLGEVLANFLAGRPLIEPGVLAGIVDAVRAERQRVDPEYADGVCSRTNGYASSQ